MQNKRHLNMKLEISSYVSIATLATLSTQFIIASVLVEYHETKL